MELTRRDTLRMVGAAGLTLVGASLLAGCGSKSAPNPSGMDSYYGDISGTPLLNSGKFGTPSLSGKWYDKVGIEFNPTIAGNIYDYFVAEAKRQDILGLRMRTIAGETTRYRVADRGTKDLTLLFAPIAAPTPGIFKQNSVLFQHDTTKNEGITIVSKAAAAASYIWLDKSNLKSLTSGAQTPQESANFLFAVNAAQAVFNVMVDNLAPEANRSFSNIYSNDYGNAFQNRQMGRSYDDYAKWVMDYFPRRYIATKEEYLAIPGIGQAITF